MKRVVFLILLFVSLPLYSQESKLGEFLQKLRESHGQIETLAVSFSQTKHFTFMASPVNSSGFIIFEYPGKVRFDITLPFASSLINDGKKVSRYEKVGDAWQKSNFASSGSVKIITDKIGSWMQGDIDTSGKVFSMSLEHDDPNIYGSLVLVPKDKRFLEHISKIKIDVAQGPDYEITRISIYEPSGDWFFMEMEKELRNCKLPERSFSDVETDKKCIELLKADIEEKGVDN